MKAFLLTFTVTMQIDAVDEDAAHERGIDERTTITDKLGGIGSPYDVEINGVEEDRPPSAARLRAMSNIAGAIANGLQQAGIVDELTATEIAASIPAPGPKGGAR